MMVSLLTCKSLAKNSKQQEDEAENNITTTRTQLPKLGEPRRVALTFSGGPSHAL
jgi:hypothetical protein